MKPLYRYYRLPNHSLPFRFQIILRSVALQWDQGIHVIALYLTQSHPVQTLQPRNPLTTLESIQPQLKPIIQRFIPKNLLQKASLFTTTSKLFPQQTTVLLREPEGRKGHWI